MKQSPAIKVYWDNPPSKKSGLTIQRTFAGYEYERKVSAASWLSSTESAAALKISLRQLYNLISDGKLKPKGKGDRLALRLSDIKSYLFKRKITENDNEVWFTE